jgi:hypothetical protein
MSTESLPLVQHALQTASRAESSRAPSADPGALVAEQLLVAGAKLIVGITSAGCVSRDLPLPPIVIVDEAVRDEGTSLHSWRRRSGEPGSGYRVAVRPGCGPLTYISRNELALKFERV